MGAYRTPVVLVEQSGTVCLTKAQNGVPLNLGDGTDAFALVFSATVVAMVIRPASSTRVLPPTIYLSFSHHDEDART